MQNTKADRKFSGRLIVSIAILALLALIFVLFSMVGINELVDIWWFESLGYQFLLLATPALSLFGICRCFTPFFYDFFPEFLDRLPLAQAGTQG